MFRLAVALISAMVVVIPAAPAFAAGNDPVDVALDPGHSRVDVGAAGGGLREYRLTLDLAQRLEARLEAAGLRVRLTRQDDTPLSAMDDPSDNERTRIEQTARIQAAMPARLFVSLHFNGGPASLHGTETYFNPDRSPDGAAADRALADALQRHVVAALRDSGYPALDRGVKTDLSAGKPYGHFFSLRGPAPSALVEALFLSNADDLAALRDDATLDAIATGCAQGLLEYLAGEPV